MGEQMKMKRKCKFCESIAFEIRITLPNEAGVDVEIDIGVYAEFAYLCPKCGRISLYKRGEEGGFLEKTTVENVLTG
jgi:hypothetical protein